MYRIISLAYGGQGNKTQGEILAQAYLDLAANVFTQSSPHFTIERRGSPINNYVRIASGFINERGKIINADMIVVFDQTLINVETFQKLKNGGWILVNALNINAFVDFLPNFDFQLATVDANSIALEYGIQARGVAIVNIVMLGAINVLLKKVSLESLLETIRKKLPSKISLSEKALEKNIKGAEAAAKKVRIWTKEEIAEAKKINGVKFLKKFSGPMQPDENCNGCRICVLHCPKGTIRLENGKALINDKYCNKCLICVEVCPKQAIKEVRLEVQNEKK